MFGEILPVATSAIALSNMGKQAYLSCIPDLEEPSAPVEDYTINCQLVLSRMLPLTYRWVPPSPPY